MVARKVILRLSFVKFFLIKVHQKRFHTILRRVKMENITQMMNFLKIREQLNKSHGTDINICKEYLLQRDKEFSRELRGSGMGFSISPGFQCLGMIGSDADQWSKRKETETLAKISNSSLNAIMAAGQRMSIRELVNSLNQKHAGNYFICRVITIPNNMVSVDMVADVPSPDDDLALRVALYNFTNQNSNLDEVIPTGTKMLVLNPFFKLTKDGGLSLISYEKKEIFAIDEELLSSKFPDLKWPALPDGVSVKPKENKPKKQKRSKKPADASPKVDFKRAGNESFVNGNYEKAIEYYTRELDVDPEHEILLSNRAAAHLKLGKFHLALADAEKVLTRNPNHVKSIYRRAKALVGLGKYDVAVKILETHMPQWNADDVTASISLFEEAKKLQLEKESQK